MRSALLISLSLVLTSACEEAAPPLAMIDAGATDIGDAALDSSSTSDEPDTGGPAFDDAAPDRPGSSCVDRDGDGYPEAECGGMAPDCDDTSDRVNPGRSEVCDSRDLDEDCNPCTIAGASDGDSDSDTFLSSTCANAFRGATPTCPPSVRVRGGRVTGTDCEDGDANVRPNQTEACNQRDDNCNDMIDEGVTSENWYLDRDGDGHAGAGEAATLACAAPSARHVRVNDDCDDTDPLVSPGAPEVCDGATRDENCNGMRNEDCGCAPIGSSQACCGTRGTQTCTGSPMGSTWSACSATTMPEVCDGIDNNCDGNVDERAVNGPGDGGVGDGGTGDGGTGDGGTALGSLRVNCYRDMDGDGFAVARSSMESLCPPGSTAGVCPNGFTTRAPAGASTTDCDDVSTVARGRFPGNREICNNLDDNCDGRTDEVCPCAVGAMQPCYGGPSGTPGVGQCRSGTQRCDATSGGGAAWGACSGEVRPGTEIRCNGADENCNGNGDDTITGSCYTGPAGTSGRGVCRSGNWTCSSGAQVCLGERTPDRSESCNGADDDCNGAVDNGFTCTQGSSRSQTAYFNDRTVTCTQSCLSGCNGYDGTCAAGSQTMSVRGHITGFWSYNPSVSMPRTNEQDMIKCGISSGYMLYGPYRRFSPGRYQLTWTGRADSVIFDFDVRNADTGATISVASLNRGLGGTYYSAGNTIDIPRAWGNARLEFRTLYRNGSNAFACSTVESFTITLVNNAFTL